MLDFEVWITDVCQAYLQTEDPLGREVYIMDVSSGFGLADDECLMLVKPLYGLSEPGDLWHVTLDRHHRKDLDMTPLTLDQALFADFDGDGLTGLSALYVDDIWRTGTKEIHEKCTATKRKFDSTEKLKPPFEFTGFNVERLANRKLAISQNRYLRKLEEPAEDAAFSMFRSMRMKLGWLTNSRPDVLFQIATISQVTKSQLTSEKRECLKKLYRAVR